MPSGTGPVDWLERLRRYALLVRLNRPIGILLLLWPTLWALWIAGDGMPAWNIVLIFIAGVALMRSAGCAINDYADRDFDGHVARTQARPIASGLVTPTEALGVFLVLSLIAASLLVFLNWPTRLMSLVALLLTAVYPFMKRYTHLPQIVLGAAFGWAVPMAFMALNEAVPMVAWLLFCSALIWALIYDTQYAMVDRDDDLKIGVKSSAILFGRHDRLIIALLQVIMIMLLLFVGDLVGRGHYYNLGVMAGVALFAYQQWLIRRREPKACFQAFLNNNQFGMVVFIGLVVDYLAAA
ncbi:MAG: 4-hydroxybenzoate octaprenyltransferase [Candidatus Thiodiazotropha sp. (ex Ctena orbiculata)]|uniref:4-hydroxybenzoate octaprenyltransferase n=1 Tax=Candidatus Thiodiazotropha taylori TaxID=2792791 RepID=A0A944MD80_9GAMM|nr:4-hydroxybenzoate octaprenyltransferase [Candidatus Thiodiazotropha taylori]MBT3025766.1 4-hydroxybenzoate octaprenyltransferase [Candidatus Thiodiazotropha taylori]MBT3033761.1 4-hydroxybenzoate octaprenyltransferase [Candidatus Thiodiazotropha taylori]MBV2135572.1 4-hydroxybenzoate octaprenyltransferase [Candidatus Thiodiazotropha taylori]PUB87278.1 MAG: 4-hydroxybenzoate octaprenyltransferase [gamma proteobacterium symbiont of Ctena orbiculata]